MNYKMMGRFIAQILVLEAGFMLPALLLCVADGEPGVALSFVESIGILLAVAGLLWLLCRHARRGFYAQEGMVCVGLCWLVMSLLGCLPFYLSGQMPHYVDALFEIVSGFTTTGASIMKDVESLSRGILYWRSFSHWLGGMGVLVFLLAVVPEGTRNTGFTLHLLRAESPGPEVGKLTPRMRESAMVLYLLYIFLTALNILFLRLGNMPWFDSFCTAFGTAGTGGFGIKNDSMASYSPYLQNVCTVFMFLFGVNFNCYYLLCLRQFRSVFKDEELRLYFGTVAGSIALISWNLRGAYPTLRETVRHAAFQVSSIITTTGFATTNFDNWPSFSKAILLSLMVIGACAGSTGGGLKVVRVLILFKSTVRNLLQLLHPQEVHVIRVNGRPLSEKVVANTNTYLAVYTIILTFSFIVLSLDGFSLTSNFSAVLACFNNIGPGLEIVGPASNYSAYSDLSKGVLIFDMLAGRLELFPILALFVPRTWMRH